MDQKWQTYYALADVAHINGKETANLNREWEREEVREF
jgi:hypothetical protein